MAKKRTGLIGTLVFHVGLLIAVIIFGFATPLPLPGEDGILINFGTDDMGAGEDEPMMSEIPEEIATPPPAETQPETESTEDFGELLMALEPMIWIIVRKYHSLSHHSRDMVQEVMVALWKNQSNVNRLKLVRMKRNKYGNRHCMATYFYFVVRAYMSKVGERFNRVFEKDTSYRVWFMAEKWMGFVPDVEAYKKFDESYKYMEKILETE